MSNITEQIEKEIKVAFQCFIQTVKPLELIQKDLLSKIEAALQNKVSDISAEALIVDAKFCPKCNPNTWGNNMFQYLPAIQKCNVCGYEHRFFDESEEYASIVNKTGGKGYEFFKGELLVKCDRLLRDKGMSSADTNECLSLAIDDLKEVFNASIVNERKDNVGVNDAIGFAKFIHTNYAPTHSMKWVKRNIDGELLTTKELYKLFQESQPKQ